VILSRLSDAASDVLIRFVRKRAIPETHSISQSIFGIN